MARLLKSAAVLLFAAFTALWLAVAPSYFEVSLYSRMVRNILAVSAGILYLAAVVLSNFDPE